jgi:hypothetical protein
MPVRTVRLGSAGGRGPGTAGHWQPPGPLSGRWHSDGPGPGSGSALSPEGCEVPLNKLIEDRPACGTLAGRKAVVRRRPGGGCGPKAGLIRSMTNQVLTSKECRQGCSCLRRWSLLWLELNSIQPRITFQLKERQLILLV